MYRILVNFENENDYFRFQKQRIFVKPTKNIFFAFELNKMQKPSPEYALRFLPMQQLSADDRKVVLHRKLFLNLSVGKFKKVFVQVIGKTLKDKGFTGKDFKWIKVQNQYVFLLQALPEKQRGECKIMCGIHALPFLEHMGLHPNELNWNTCFFRKQIEIPTTEAYFDFGINQKEAEETCLLILSLFEEIEKFWDTWTEYPNQFINQKYSDIQENKFQLPNILEWVSKERLLLWHGLIEWQQQNLDDAELWAGLIRTATRLSPLEQCMQSKLVQKKNPYQCLLESSDSQNEEWLPPIK